MPETSYTPITDQGPALLDRLEAETGVYPFRMATDGRRSYAAALDELDAALTRLQADWRDHLAPTR